MCDPQTLFLFKTLAIEMYVKYILLLLLAVALIILYIYDREQKEHSIWRNYPIIGHMRNFLESLGVYLRQYFFAMDREELPFNRATRSWIYRAAKNVENVEGFGSTRDLQPVGTIIFVDAPFPSLGQNVVMPQEVTIGPHCRTPYVTRSLFNISAMSYGAMSKEAIEALSQGARMASCWLNTGEGGISPYHLSGGADLIAQIGTAKYGFRDLKGNLDEQCLREAAQLPQIKMFEIKLSQGAKPGKGGILPGIKVTEEVAQIRGITVGEDSISPNRHTDIRNSQELLDKINYIREVTGKPVGFKIVLGSYEWLDDFCLEVVHRGIHAAPDFITLDSKDGGTGAAPVSLMDYVGLPIKESLPVLVNKLTEYGLRSRVKVIASGKLVTPGDVAWALCVGADFINSARGFMFSLGCVQALRCHLNTCPTGITSHNPRYRRGLDPVTKAERVYHYASNMVHEVGIICHSCGVEEPRQLQRHHARRMMENGLTMLLSELYPIPEQRYHFQK
ncbi:MAG: FMN-binding glutamate synthase family protein [Gammaproteobacteria bacterium]|nr:FMN-binding glutamate synthase family protein [Gammaproteobacteria bacterium]